MTSPAWAGWTASGAYTTRRYWSEYWRLKMEWAIYITGGVIAGSILLAGVLIASQLEDISIHLRQLKK